MPKTRKSKKKTPNKPKKERCMICKEPFDRLTQSHLKTHGFTTNRYRRVFGGMRAPGRDGAMIPIGSPASSERSSLIGSVAERIAEDKVWLACIADEVGERMLTGPLRQRLTALLTTMLAQRAAVQGRAMAILNSSLNELTQDWRVLQGGRDGEHTDTDQLLRIVDRATKLVKDSEEAVMKTMKLALDEQRTAHEFADGAGPTLFSGDSDKLQVPAQLSSGDRETMRGLLSILQAAAAHDADAENTIEVTPLGRGGGGGGEAPRDVGGCAPPLGEGERASQRANPPSQSHEGNINKQVPAQSSTRTMSPETMATDPTRSDDDPVDPLAMPSSRKKSRRRRPRSDGDAKVDSDSSGGPPPEGGTPRATANP